MISFVSGESSDCVVEGVTITGGGGRDIGSAFGGIHTLAGGGVFCANSYPVIRKCILRHNQAELGGAIYAEGDLHDVSPQHYVTLEDCVLYRNTSTDYDGGAIYVCDRARILIQRNQIHQNMAANGSGGAIGVQTGATALIYDNDIYENTAQAGGGVFVAKSSATEVMHNRIHRNEASRYGGAIKLREAPILCDKNVYYANTAGVEGGVVQCACTDRVAFANSILWRNWAPAGSNICLRYNESRTSYPSKLMVDYSDLDGGAASCIQEAGTTLMYGPGNFDVDPLFADSVNGDFHLRSQYGRWDPVDRAWVIDASTSECIDAGNPADPGWTEELWPHGKRINIGAYAGTAQASMSGAIVGNACDIDDDGQVNVDDLALMAFKWLDSDLLIPENVDHANLVNLGDLSVCSKNWLWSE